MDASEVLFPPLDSSQQLSEYAENYYSDELDGDYKLTLEGNSLILQISENLQPTLSAAYADVFTAPGGIILHISIHEVNYQYQFSQARYLLCIKSVSKMPLFETIKSDIILSHKRPLLRPSTTKCIAKLKYSQH